VATKYRERERERERTARRTAKKITEDERKDNRMRRQRAEKRTHVFHKQGRRRGGEGRGGHSYRRFHTHVGKTVALSGAPMNNLESFARAENRSPVEQKER